ncbi:MAG: stage III sporulation protein AC [Clostridia bacterium]|nr:stage III sporulation protein AC [Clostridia bacterium]
MDVALILKVAGVGILVSACHQILSRAGREDQAMLVSIAGTVIVLVLLAQKIGELFEAIRVIFGI